MPLSHTWMRNINCTKQKENNMRSVYPVKIGLCFKLTVPFQVLFLVLCFLPARAAPTGIRDYSDPVPNPTNASSRAPDPVPNATNANSSVIDPILNPTTANSNVIDPVPNPINENCSITFWMDIPILVVVGLAFIIAITILLNKCRRELCGNCGELCDLGTGQNTEENRPLLGENDWRRAHDETDNITLDANTAHPNLCIDEDEKSFKHEAQPQKVPSNPERFDSTVCVLGSQGFSSGKHYWEVDVEKSSDWDLGVARKSTKRKGKLSLSPKEGFWALGLNGRDYWAKTDPWTRVMVQKKTKKIGVYLSYQERRVTFLSVTHMSVLFTFNDCSFSGEVYPFFKNSHKETTMSICSFKQKE
ncbi:unnamed protein product [Natator depressus]